MGDYRQKQWKEKCKLEAVRLSLFCSKL